MYDKFDWMSQIADIVNKHTGFSLFDIVLKFLHKEACIGDMLG